MFLFSFFVGSAVCKSLTPAILSSGLYLVLLYTTDLTDDDEQILLHPYAMGALIAALTFLLAFRANFAYNRYWEVRASEESCESSSKSVRISPPYDYAILSSCQLESDIRPFLRYTRCTPNGWM